MLTFTNPNRSVQHSTSGLQNVVRHPTFDARSRRHFEKLTQRQRRSIRFEIADHELRVTDVDLDSPLNPNGREADAPTPELTFEMLESLLPLPNEITLTVLQFAVDSAPQLAALSLVSRSFHSFVNDTEIADSLLWSQALRNTPFATQQPSQSKESEAANQNNETPFRYLECFPSNRVYLRERTLYERFTRLFEADECSFALYNCSVNLLVRNFSSIANAAEDSDSDSAESDADVGPAVSDVNERVAFPTVLIAWCPDTAPVKSRMLYSSSLVALRVDRDFKTFPVLQATEKSELSFELFIRRFLVYRYMQHINIY